MNQLGKVTKMNFNDDGHIDGQFLHSRNYDPYDHDH